MKYAEWVVLYLTLITSQPKDETDSVKKGLESGQAHDWRMGLTGLETATLLNLFSPSAEMLLAYSGYVDGFCVPWSRHHICSIFQISKNVFNKKLCQVLT